MKPRELSDLILLAAIWGSSLRLITQVGPTQAASITLLVPVFTVVWAALALGERVRTPMSIGGAVILAGTALVLGLLPRRRVLGPGGPR